MGRIAFVLFVVLASSLACGKGTDYAGFWKESCSDAYGLQIKRLGERYAVTFCGPGGCGVPDANAGTLIEGDTHYEVLSPDRLRIKYSDAYTPIYIKCTNDTNPVLEYSAADRAAERNGILVAIAFHLAYLVCAVFVYRVVHRRTREVAPLGRRVARSGVAALLFTPGLLFTWPFVTPTFALLGLVAFLFTIPQIFSVFTVAQVLYSIGPVLLVWVIVFAVAQVRSKGGGDNAANRGA